LNFPNENLIGTSFTIPAGNLVSGEKYRWNMVSFDANGNESSVSNALYFYVNVPTTTLPAPILMSPQNGDIISTVTPKFEWKSVLGADYYGLYIRNIETNVLVFDSEMDIGPIVGTTFTLPENKKLEAGKSYYWNMRAYSNTSGWGSFATHYTFVIGNSSSTNMPPQPPTLVYPQNGSTITSSSDLHFEWSNPIDSTCSWLFIKNSSTGIDVWASGHPLVGDSISTLPVALGNGAYEWWVISQNTAGLSPESSHYKFTVNMPDLLPPPENDSIKNDLPVVLIRQVQDVEKEVPDFRGEWACGATCAVMVLNYWNNKGYNTLPKEKPAPWYVASEYSINGYLFNRTTKTPEWHAEDNNGDGNPDGYELTGFAFPGAYGYIHYNDGNAKNDQICEYLRKHGCYAVCETFTPFDPDSRQAIENENIQAKIKNAIDKGCPVIMSTFLWPEGHYVVIRGYVKEKPGYYIVNDPFINDTPLPSHVHVKDNAWPQDEGPEYHKNDGSRVYTWKTMMTRRLTLAYDEKGNPKARSLITIMPINSGDEVLVQGGGINVRESPNSNGNLLGIAYGGTRGKILEGPYSEEDAYTWWKINYEEIDYKDGKTGPAIGWSTVSTKKLVIPTIQTQYGLVKSINSDTVESGKIVIDNDEDTSDDIIDTSPNSARVASLDTITKNGIIKLETEDGYFSNMASLYDDAPSLSQIGKPTNYNFKYGVVQFELKPQIPGSTVSIALTFPEPVPSDAKYFKITSSGWEEYPFTIDASNPKKIQIQLTDGGQGDEDGVKNGVIVDPSSLGIPSSTPPSSGGGGGGGCFIATACFGDYNHPFVKVLREFRDRVLLTTNGGRAFVRWYYRHSPKYARMIAGSEILKAMTRISLLPLVCIAYLLVKGLFSYLAFGLGMLVLARVRR
jgi:hypothetical protein